MSDRIVARISSGSVINVTGKLFRVRNIFFWTVRMDI